MQNNSHTVGASAPITFADGTELLMSPLSDRDIEELNEWVRAEFIKMVRNSLPTDCPNDKYQLEMTLAFSHAVTLSWMSGAGSKFMSTPNGIARLVYQSVLKRQPTITFEKVRELMYSPENIKRSTEIFEQLNTPPRKKGAHKKKSQ